MNNWIKKGMVGQGRAFFREWNNTAAMGAPETPLGHRGHHGRRKATDGHQLQCAEAMEKQDLCSLGPLRAPCIS